MDWAGGWSGYFASDVFTPQPTPSPTPVQHFVLMRMRAEIFLLPLFSPVIFIIFFWPAGDLLAPCMLNFDPILWLDGPLFRRALSEGSFGRTAGGVTRVFGRDRNDHGIFFLLLLV